MKAGDIVYTAKDLSKARPEVLGHKIFAVGETYILVQSGHGSEGLSKPTRWKGYHNRLHKRDLYLSKKEAEAAYKVKRPTTGDYVTAVIRRSAYADQELVQGLVVEVKSNWALKILSAEGDFRDIKKGCYVILQRGVVN